MGKVLKNKKAYELELSGDFVDDYIFKVLSEHILTNGCDAIRYNSRRLEYPFGAYLAVKEDMRDLKEWVKKNCYISEMKEENRKRKLTVKMRDGKILIAEIVAYEIESIL